MDSSILAVDLLFFSSPANDRTWTSFCCCAGGADTETLATILSPLKIPWRRFVRDP